MNFAVTADHKAKLKEGKKRDKYQELAWELKKTMERESDSDTNYNWCSWYNHQTIGTGTWGLGKKRKSRDHPNNSII